MAKRKEKRPKNNDDIENSISVKCKKNCNNIDKKISLSVLLTAWAKLSIRNGIFSNEGFSDLIQVCESFTCSLTHTLTQKTQKVKKNYELYFCE